jgi:hypothetical protein
MNKIQATALFTGFLLVFGAVGGMDNPDQADMFFHQLAAALIGVFLMFMAVFTTAVEVRDE